MRYDVVLGHRVGTTGTHRPVGKAKDCLRCGRSVRLGGNSKSVIVCKDCRDSDPTYVARLMA